MISDRASNWPVSRRGVIVGVAPIIAAPLRRWPARSWMEQRSANGAQLPKRLCRADGSSCPRTRRSQDPSGSAQLGGGCVRTRVVGNRLFRPRCGKSRSPLTLGWLRPARVCRGRQLPVLDCRRGRAGSSRWQCWPAVAFGSGLAPSNP